MDNQELKNLKCPYCGSNVLLEKSQKIYGEDYGLLYICEKYPACNSYVGCHKGTTIPLGRLANRELRIWKKNAHAAFDPLWKRKFEKRKKEDENYKKKYARGSGYKWLATQLEIEMKDCHIGMFDVDQCKKVVELCKPYLRKNQYK